MKRDMDLVRRIMLTTEKADSPIGDGVLIRCCEDMGKLAFHVELMRSHGLVHAGVERDGFGEPFSVEITGLTWDGYDYLDAIRSPKVWNQAKEAISKTVGDTSLSVVKDVCVSLAASLVKAQLGI